MKNCLKNILLQKIHLEYIVLSTCLSFGLSTYFYLVNFSNLQKMLWGDEAIDFSLAIEHDVLAKSFTRHLHPKLCAFAGSVLCLSSATSTRQLVVFSKIRKKVQFLLVLNANTLKGVTSFLTTRTYTLGLWHYFFLI